MSEGEAAVGDCVMEGDRASARRLEEEQAV